jgi:uncharacterized membrane protein
LPAERTATARHAAPARARRLARNLLLTGVVVFRHPTDGARDATGDPVTIEKLTARNVESVVKIEAGERAKRTFGDRVADAISAFCGSTSFIWTHVLWFGVWIAGNTLPGLRPFDPFPFQFLTLVVSLEAIFLSTFILISENRQARLADRRNLLDLQINLLAEQENTKMLSLLHRIAEKVGVALDDAEVAAMEAETDYAQLTDQIEEIENEEEKLQKHQAK